MPALVIPTVDVRASFLAAMAEFVTEGRGGPDDRSSIGADLQRLRGADEDEFNRYVTDLRADSLDATPRPDDRVPCTTLWWVDGDEFIGRIAVRHRLTDFLLEQGGHIGYDVRPSRRLQGHATAMLRAVVPVAFDLGIHPALVTCDVTNDASRRVIEKVGGEFEDQRSDKLRFWVPTRPSRHRRDPAEDGAPGGAAVGDDVPPTVGESAVPGVSIGLDSAPRG